MHKKIGILTFHYPENRNFGAILQAYAVQTLYRKMGFKSKLIDFTIETKGNLKGELIQRILLNGFYDFRNKFLSLTSKIKSEKDFKRLNNQFDYFSVGSDQVWRPVWLKENQKYYFLDFVNNDKKKISYAASFGVDYWECPSEKTQYYKSLIKRFYLVSTREESGVEICKKEFDIDAICVLDPTLMLEKKDYDIILKDYKSKKHLAKNYIAHMLLDDSFELKNASKKIAKYLKSEINYIKGKNIKFLNKNFFKYNKVSQWLTYIKDSQLVITDSFHCTIFSIIFEKNFIVLANSNRGITRLRNILSKIGLQDRFFNSVEDIFESGILDKNIDYKDVNQKIKILKDKSFKFFDNI